MSGHMNEMTLIGNLGADPEVRSMQNGGRVVSFSVATTDTWTDRASGERREATEWHRVVVFNDGLGKIAESYLKKGSKVMVRGPMRSRKWQDQAGVDRTSSEVTLSGPECLIKLLSPKPGNAEGAPRAGAAAPRQSQGQAGGQQTPSWDAGDGFDEDRIPF